MKLLACLLSLLIGGAAFAQAPTPITVGPIDHRDPIPGTGNALSVVSILPPVTTANTGNMTFYKGGQNGSESSGGATGSIYVVNNNGSWAQVTGNPPLTVTVGGQGIFLGGATKNQGNGDSLQLATSLNPGVNGQCAQFDSNLNIVPSGGGCGAGGGSGTVSSGSINQLGYYAAAGTTISGLPTANSGALVTNGTGVPSISSTLPSGMTIPSPSISNPTITGTGTYVALTGSGLLNTAASVVGTAGLRIPPGAAPTSPVNGDVWTTAAGLFIRIAGTTHGPYIALADLSGTSPIVDTSGVFSCPTCAVSGTSPVVVSGGVVSLNPIIGASSFVADSATSVHADTYPLPASWPWTSGTIDSIHFATGGTGPTPSFVVTVQINGLNVTGCSSITVNAVTDTAATCTAANTVASGNKVTLVITSPVANPFSSYVQINYHHSPT